MTISVVTIAKNIVSQGYCWWESLESVLPLADEIIISEGYSTDNTHFYLMAFGDSHTSLPIKIFQSAWPETSYHGESIRIVSEEAVQKATKDWILYLQLDEIYHGDTIDFIKETISKPYNSLSFPFYHFNRAWEPSKEGYKEAIRMVKRSSGAKLKGDAWTFNGSDPICPAYLCPKPVYHFNWIFPKSNDIKDIEHGKLYTNIPEYREKMLNACQNLNKEKFPYPRTDFDDFPVLARRFVGAAEYTLPIKL
jgi:hypothetical protein